MFQYTSTKLLGSKLINDKTKRIEIEINEWIKHNYANEINLNNNFFPLFLLTGLNWLIKFIISLWIEYLWLRWFDWWIN